MTDMTDARHENEATIDLAPDGRKVTAGPQQPWTWQIVELFEIRKGQLHQIQAIMERSPYGMNSGWSSWEDGLSDRGRDVTKQ